MKISKEEAIKVYDKNNYTVVDYFSLPMKWHDPFNKNEFHIANSYVADKFHTFFRFTKEEIATLKETSSGTKLEATRSAGIQLQFITDSRFIRVKCKNTDPFNMKNMSFAGMCGFDTYYFDEKFNKWMFNRAGVFPEFKSDQEYITDIAAFLDKKERKMIIDFPLYNGVVDLEVELEEGCFIKPWEYENKKKIIVYGTSIIQGCSASRPGMATTNVVSREFAQEVVNYGFSGSANLEPEVAKIIASRDDCEMLIVDCEANAGTSMDMFNNIEEFFRIWYEKHPNEPVVVMNRLRCQYDGYYPFTYEAHELCDRIMKEMVKKYQKEGKNIRFVDNFSLFNEDETEFTIECLHPNDVGMDVLSKSYINVINEIKRSL